MERRLLLYFAFHGIVARKPSTNILRRNAGQTTVYAHPAKERTVGCSQIFKLLITESQGVIIVFQVHPKTLISNFSKGKNSHTKHALKSVRLFTALRRFTNEDLIPSKNKTPSVYIEPDYAYIRCEPAKSQLD